MIGTARVSVRRRTLALAASVAVLAALLPAPAAAESVDPRGIDRVCPPIDMEPDDGPRFDDAEGTRHESAITCVAQYGIASGRADGGYHPNAEVTRGQMASLIRSFVETARGEEIPDAEPDFTDVRPGSTHAASIGAVAEAGIAGGFGDGTYRPGAPVRRDQMATFVARAIDYAYDGRVGGEHPPPAQERHFDDTEGSPHAGNIDRLAAQGIVAGVAERRYAPARLVTRGQMATFLMRGADYLDEDYAWRYAPFQFLFDPEFTSHLVGDEHAFTLTLLDRDDAPLVGEDVAIAGYRLNAQELTPLGTVTTDGEGRASFSYTGPATTEFEYVVACIRPADCEDESRSAGRAGAAVVLWAREAQSGETSDWELLAVAATADNRFDSWSIDDDDYAFVVRRWAYTSADTFRDDSGEESREMTLAEFEEMIDEPAACILAIEAYSTTGPSTFVVIACGGQWVEDDEEFTSPPS